MKICAFLFEVLLVMAILVTPSSAREYTPQETLLCNAKGTVVQYAYTNRHVVTKEQAFKALDVTWEERWTSLHYATYIDMKRIIEGAYRRQKGGFQGGYRRQACNAGDTYENSEQCRAIISERSVKECREALRNGF